MKTSELVYFNTFRFLRKKHIELGENTIIVKSQNPIKLKYHFSKALLATSETISTVISTISFLNLRKVQPTNYYLIKVIETLPLQKTFFIYQVPRRNINIDSDSDINSDLKSTECDQPVCALAPRIMNSGFFLDNDILNQRNLSFLQQY